MSSLYVLIPSPYGIVLCRTYIPYNLITLLADTNQEMNFGTFAAVE